MNKPSEVPNTEQRGAVITRAVDTLQQQLTDYACKLRFEDLPPEVVHTAKLRVIDTLASLIGGFFADPCRIARDVAAAMPNPAGATVIGTRMKTSPEMAAYVNAATARYVEMNDIYHWPGAFGGHPSDVLTPILAAAEHAQVSGRDFITGVVLGYEVYQRFSDIFRNVSMGFDHTNFCTLGSAVASAKMFKLDAQKTAHCISMAAVPNVILRQVRADHYSMYKAVASGHAGRAGVFAAILARAGMEGPHLPFEGKAGWAGHVARDTLKLEALGGNGTEFRIMQALVKPRAACGTTISSIMAAEKIAPLNLNEVKQVTVEVYQKAKDRVGTGEHRWNPDTRETADHSIPYVVAATLMDGTITPRSFNDMNLWNPELRALIHKIEVVANDEFSKAYVRHPVEHRTRVTVLTNNGEKRVGEAGGDENDLNMPKSDSMIESKFRSLCEDSLGVKQVRATLDLLWRLDTMENVSAIPPALVIA
jgi:2-methylcitrate dehydratase